MKKTFAKQILSVLLSVLMIALSVPLVFAEEGTTALLNQSDYDIEGTNSLGNMISSAVESEEIDPYASYNISNVAVEEQTITVSFNNAAECTLVVAAYEEESMQMLSSASENVEANAKEVSVLLPNMTAEYMIIKAFLLDDYRNALCKEYTFRGYTKDYQDFEKKTVNDFDAEKVINLDEAIDNNFLVLTDGTIRVAPNDGANVLVSSDFEDNIFVFANAGNDIRALKSGDLFYFDNGDYENMIIITVQSVVENSDGTIAVKGDTILLEDAFQFIHIDASASDFDLDESTVGDHMSVYEETTTRKLAPKRVGVNIEHEFEKTWGFEFDKKFYTNGTEAEDYDDETASVKFEGSGSFGCKADFKINLCSDYQEVSIVFTPNLTLDFSLKGKISFLNIPLGEFSARALGVLKFSLNPKFVIRGGLEVSTKVTAGFSVGFGFNPQDGFVNKCEWPSVEFDGIKIEGTLFVGFDLNPEVSLLSDEVAEADMSGEAGVEVTASNSWFEHTWGKTDIHLCNNCIGGEIKLKINLKANLSFAKNRTWGKRKSFDIAGFSFDITDFYWSITFGEHGWGECPFKLDDSNKFNGHYYQAFDEGMTWGEANDFCSDLGGHLATITSEEEQQFISSMISSGAKNSYWLGATKIGDLNNNQFEWITGEVWSYDNGKYNNNMKSGGEDCLMIYRLNNPRAAEYAGEWNDLNGDGTCGDEPFFGTNNFGFICEWDSKPSKTKAPTNPLHKAPAAVEAAFETIVSGNSATRTDAFPGAEYVLLVVKNANAENLLASDNLLYIDQKTADSSTITFDFVPREEVETFTATIYGQSHSHTPGEAMIENEVAATCKAGGSYDEVVYCSACGEELSRTTVTTDPVDHIPAAAARENEAEATCKEPGSYDEVIYCSACEEELSRKTITTEKLPHADENNDGKCDACGTQMQGGDHCKYCGKVHTGPFAWLVKFFHNIFASFKRK